MKFFYALVMKQIKNLDGHYELFKSLEEPDHEVVLSGLKLSSSNTRGGYRRGARGAQAPPKLP